MVATEVEGKGSDIVGRAWGAPRPTPYPPREKDGGGKKEWEKGQEVAWTLSLRKSFWEVDIRGRVPGSLAGEEYAGKVIN